MKIRLTGELKQSIEQAATSAGRSMNAEIVNRLKSSFEEKETAPLPISIQMAVDDEAEEAGCTPEQALINLVLKGQSQGGTVLNLRIAPNTTVQQVRDAINAASELIPPNSNLTFERENNG